MAEGGEAPDEEPILTTKDEQQLVLKLFPARYRSAQLGIRLGLPDADVEALHAERHEPRDQLEWVIREVLKGRPELSWRDVISALRNPEVGLYDLANQLEADKNPAPHIQPPPDSSDALYPEDTLNIMEVLWPARNKSYVLGLKLGLPAHEVESIYTIYKDPQERLSHIISAFLNIKKQKPTWKIIINALQSPSVGLPALAREIEYSYAPCVTPTASDSTPQLQVGPIGLVTSNLPEVMCEDSVENVSKTIGMLKQRFGSLKNNVKSYLEKRRIGVRSVADCLTSISPDDDDHVKLFMESHVSSLFSSPDMDHLFGVMNFHWNYLNPYLLHNMVKEFDLKEVKHVLEAYNADLTQFRKMTLLTLYCRVQKRKRIQLTPEFREIVAEFDWPDIITLEDAEQFRREYASHYSLHEFAMMLAQVRPG